VKFLQDELAKAASAEVRVRIEEILGELTSPLPRTAEELRASRAVRVLELMGNGPARELLSRLAAGGPGRLTRDADAALARLKPLTGLPASAPAP